MEMDAVERLFWPDDEPESRPGYYEYVVREAVFSALQSGVPADCIRETVETEIAQFAKEAH